MPSNRILLAYRCGFCNYASMIITYFTIVPENPETTP
jgi:hypothetical protein